jgi:hypothetical protein
MAIPAAVITRCRAEARALLASPTATASQRRTAWRFLKQWSVA